MGNIFWMAFCNLGYSLRCCIHFVKDYPSTGPFVCFLNGATGVFFVLATQSWYFIISWHTLTTLWFESTPRWMNSRYFYHIYAWGISTSVTIITFHTVGLEPHI